MIRRFVIAESTSEKEYNAEKHRTDNPFGKSSFLHRIISAIKSCFTISVSVWFKNVLNNLLRLFAKMKMTISSDSLNILKKELSMYYRLEQYACYPDINDAKNYIQKSIDNYKNILINKKNEPITVNGKELTYGDYIQQLSDDQLEIFVQILHKKGNENLTYGDLQKLSQTIEAQKKQGGTAFLLDCENLPGDSSAVTDYVEEIQKFINQKHEELMLLDKIACLYNIEEKKEQLEEELISYFGEDVLNEVISEYKTKTLYNPVEKEVLKNNDGSIVAPISATEYRVITEHDGIISAVYAGKTQTAAKTYYRSVSGHFYNQNGHEEKPSELYNADKTLKAEILYDSEENGYKILKETDFTKDETKTVSSVTHYKYDVGGKFIWKYTEGVNNGVSNGLERYYYNHTGTPCKCEKEYEHDGINYRDVYGYSDGKINDTPISTYMLLNNNWKKTVKPEI
ncbi:hypothetical protein IJI31_00835 [bacterium]|nr:hypothetical protein [bacterium]